MDEECATEVKNQGEWGACELSEDTLRRGKWSAAAGVAERLGERERLEVSVAVSNAAVTEKWTSPQFFFFFFAVQDTNRGRQDSWDWNMGSQVCR